MDGDTLPPLAGEAGGLCNPVEIFSDKPDRFSLISVNFLLTSFRNFRAEESFVAEDFPSSLSRGVVGRDSFDERFSVALGVILPRLGLSANFSRLRGEFVPPSADLTLPEKFNFFGLSDRVAVTGGV